MSSTSPAGTTGADLPIVSPPKGGNKEQQTKRQKRPDQKKINKTTLVSFTR
jgi:hypothetical protein